MRTPLQEGPSLRALRRWSKAPLVFAHRGASGYLPEHTLPAYALAHGLGADVLEPDVVLTRDRVPICLHDIHLERVTDVSAVFPDRARGDGRFYALDFSLDEVRRLTATGGERHRLGGAGIPTFEEFLRFVIHLGERTGRAPIIAPEMKAPAFHAEAGADLVGAVAHALKASGHAGEEGRSVVQCFEPEGLIALRRDHGVSCPLLQLIGAEPLDGGQLDRVAEYAEMVGPSKRAITDTDGAFVDACHQRGLGVVPYTFKDDVDETSEHFHRFGVDGLFSDFPDVALRARDGR